MKKWYKNYLDAQKKAQPKSDNTTSLPNKPVTRPSNTHGGAKKFRDPVAVGKRTRSKTFGAS